MALWTTPLTWQKATASTAPLITACRQRKGPALEGVRVPRSRPCSNGTEFELDTLKRREDTHLEIGPYDSLPIKTKASLQRNGCPEKTLFCIHGECGVRVGCNKTHCLETAPY